MADIAVLNVARHPLAQERPALGGRVHQLVEHVAVLATVTNHHHSRQCTFKSLRSPSQSLVHLIRLHASSVGQISTRQLVTETQVEQRSIIVVEAGSSGLD